MGHDGWSSLLEQSDNKPFAVDLKSLYQLAGHLFSERQEINLTADTPLHIENLYKVGTSAGGMCPKAIIAINEKTGEIRSGQAELPAEYDYYIIKFNEGKKFPFTLVEMAYYLMANAAGINMMPSRLIEIDGRQHFLTGRRNLAYHACIRPNVHHRLGCTSLC